MQFKSQRPPAIKITRWDLFRVFISSFFMQAAWNFRSLISIGFSFCLFPVLKKLYPDAEDKKQFLLRHLKFFNSHPYFASYALGVSLHLEELASKGEDDICQQLERLKELLISPLGAIGDRLFWATIKPASLSFGIVGLLISQTTWLKITFLILAFAVYNIPHLYFRYRGIIEGYQYGVNIYKYIGQERFEKLHRIYKLIFIISLMIIIFVFAFQLYQIQPGLVPFFFFSIVYVMILIKIVRNFYLVCASAFIFFITVGILFF